MAQGQITLSEINSQPQIWREALAGFESQSAEVLHFWSDGAFEQVLFTGCGSTYYLGVMAAALLQAETGVPARALSASELMLFPEANYSSERRTLLICLSRSGTTRETNEAVRQFRQHGSGSVLVITCDSQSPLAQSADLLLAIDAAQEQSRVQTRSFSSMAVTATALAAVCAGRDWRPLTGLPTALEQLMARSETVVQSFGGDTSIHQFAFLGSGARYGIASEAMLKMTEMSRIFSTSYAILEYLHGPHYAADAHTLVAALVSDAAAGEEWTTLARLRGRPCQVLTLAEGYAPADLRRVRPTCHWSPACRNGAG
ncbi:MAG: SIS domain-containing protein [Chloroflexi bacterium]|nr:SIS domain-containing protein [Chloroflexota bacterium]